MTPESMPRVPSSVLDPGVRDAGQLVTRGATRDVGDVDDIPDPIPEEDDVIGPDDDPMPEDANMVGTDLPPGRHFPTGPGGMSGVRAAARVARAAEGLGRAGQTAAEGIGRAGQTAAESLGRAGRAAGEATLREARDSFRQGVRGVGAIAGTTRDKLPGVITQASGVVAGDELFKALNQQSNNRQQAPTQPFIAIMQTCVRLARRRPEVILSSKVGWVNTV